jgi:RNA polymerase sigma-70 factor (ECF subfamily)
MPFVTLPSLGTETAVAADPAGAAARPDTVEAAAGNASPPIESMPARSASDADLVDRILAGDDTLFELIMRRCNRLLFRLARAIVRDDDEARDVVQAAYIRAYYRLEEFRGPNGIKSWLARIVINEANGRQRRASIVICDDDAVPESAALAGWEPEQRTMGLQTLILVQQAIDELPDEFRAVFMLRGVEELSVAETAAVLELKEATVKTRFHRARRLLRASLGRHSADDVREAYRFDGSRCDEIVAEVLSRIRAERMPARSGP